MNQTLRTIAYLLTLAIPLAAHAAPPAWVDGYRLRYVLRVVSDLDKTTAKTVACAIPTGSWVDDAKTIVVQRADGERLPVHVLAHDANGETLIQFPRHGDDAEYYAYVLPGANTTPPPATVAALPAEQMREGMFGQVRHWDGPSLDSWQDVRAGLVEGQVQAHALVGEMMHYSNPAAPQHTDHFAISYRGYLNVKTPGTYRLAANGDQATFLFLDGELIEQTPGRKLMATSGVGATFGVEIELTAGPHLVEYHQALGDHIDTPRDRPAGAGALLWLPPDEKRWQLVPRTAFIAAAYAEPVELQHADGRQAAAFTYGMDDFLAGDGYDIHLVRFEATGHVTDETKLQWDFGDGQTTTGRSVTHIYFGDGEYDVTLDSGDGLPTYQRRVIVWTPPFESSPLSLGRVVQRLSTFDLEALDPVQLGRVFVFLTHCEDPARWPVLEKVARHALKTDGLDIDFQGQLYEALIEAIANQNRVNEAITLADETAKRFAVIDTLAARMMLVGADVQRDHGGDLRDAVTRYETILERYRRLEAPVVREAAIHLGDLYARTGDMDAAMQVYETAVELGGRRFARSANAAAVDRGTMLRIVEDNLASGQTRIAQRLLTQLELEHPQQKLEGYFQLLAGEVDRAAGRYAEALQAYELILAFPQWSGLRDQAMHGAAVCNERLDRFDPALHWLMLLEEAEPLYFQKHDLASYRERVERRKAGGGATFAGLSVTFEPQTSPRLRPEPPLAPGMGIDGPQSVMAWGGGDRVVVAFNAPLPALAPDETYWVSVWCRHAIGNLAQSGQPAINLTLAPNHAPAGYTAEPWPVWGQWLRLGGQVTPASDEPTHLRVIVQRFLGIVLLDGLSLQPVSPRQQDALLNFTQGTMQP